MSCRNPMGGNSTLENLMRVIKICHEEWKCIFIICEFSFGIWRALAFPLHGESTLTLSVSQFRESEILIQVHMTSQTWLKTWLKTWLLKYYKYDMTGLKIATKRAHLGVIGSHSNWGKNWSMRKRTSVIGVIKPLRWVGGSLWEWIIPFRNLKGL